MKREIFCFALIALLVVSSFNVYADELYQSDDLQVFNSNGVYDDSGDSYEFNDTIERAYDFNYTEPITNVIDKRGVLYALGMRSSRISKIEDVDWYRNYFNRNTYIFADLRNIGQSKIDFAIYGPNKQLIFDSAQIQKFNGKAEKYFDYRILVSGQYYFKVYSSGDISLSNYFFYFGPKNNMEFSFDFGLTNMYLSPIRDTTAITELSAFLPKSAVCTEMRVLNTTSLGMHVPNIEFRFGRNQWTEESYVADSQGVFTSISGQNLYTRVRVIARSSNASGSFIPVIKGKFRCNMDPYPGNE